MIAKVLADLAYKHSVDFYYDSPYSIRARTRGFDVTRWKKVLGQKPTGSHVVALGVSTGYVCIFYLDW
nr:hypothetical protein [Tanacetum cinerariifolium]